MKTSYLVAVALAISTLGMAQKDEIKAASKAFKSGDFSAAKTALEGAAGVIGSSDDKTQAEYYTLLGDTNRSLSNYEGAIAAYNKVVEIEAASGKAKYTTTVQQSMTQMSGEIINSAIDDEKNSRYKESALKLAQAYNLSPKDTIYLYYAASTAVKGGPDLYDMAIDYYSQLKDLNYDGTEISYSAVDVETGETVPMDKNTYDLYQKSNAYKDFKEEKSPSKRAEIVKNIALIYQEQGKNELALQAYEDAMASNPEDVNLVLNKANLYYKMGDNEQFKQLMYSASQMAPDNPDLMFNIGVINMEQGNIKEAREAYNKTLAIDPNYINALLNLSTTFVNEGNALVDEMNSLGTSRADAQRYDQLKSKRDDLFKQGAGVLEKALEKNADNQSILTQLKNIYGALGDNENFMRMKKLLGE